MPKNEHKRIPTIKSVFDGNPRNQLAKDIRDLRNNTNTPLIKQEELIRMTKKLFPEAMKKNQ